MVITILEILPEFSYSFAPVIELDQAHPLFEFLSRDLLMKSLIK